MLKLNWSKNIELISGFSFEMKSNIFEPTHRSPVDLQRARDRLSDALPWYNNLKIDARGEYWSATFTCTMYRCYLCHHKGGGRHSNRRHGFFFWLQGHLEGTWSEKKRLMENGDDWQQVGVNRSRGAGLKHLKGGRVASLEEARVCLPRVRNDRKTVRYEWHAP